jgi:hypothetical protein
MTIADISCKLPATKILTTLGGESQFTVVNQGGAVVIINSLGKIHTLDDALVAAVFQRYSTLASHRRMMADDYVNPNWPQCPNRIFAPYVARLIDFLQ